MRDWMTIGQFATQSGLTARAIRLYEARGLLKSARGENDYRCYTARELERARQIKELKDLGFVLAEIEEILKQDPTLTNFKNFLQAKVRSLKTETSLLSERIRKLEDIITSLEQIPKLSEPQRRFIMEEVLSKAKERIQSRGVRLSTESESFLRQEVQDSLQRHYPQMMEALDLVKAQADEMGLRLGPGRGSAAASLLLYSKGLTPTWPQPYRLLPELFYHSRHTGIWIDVASHAAAEFLQALSRKISIDDLKRAKVFIFQCPFLEILARLETQLGPLPFDEIADDSPIVLRPFHEVRLGGIFLFNEAARSLMNANSTLEFLLAEKNLKGRTKELLKAYKVQGIDDILNLMTLNFPIGNKEELLQQYLKSPEWVPTAAALPEEIRVLLKATKGLLIYREDVIRILQNYTGWPTRECNLFYLAKFKEQPVDAGKYDEYMQTVPSEIREFLEENIPGVFLKSHMVAMWWFVKRSAILSSLHPQEYQAALLEWEKNHNGAWSDLGFIDKDYRPLALYWD